MVDRNLFLHDLAVVAILKNEAPYLKEWIDYHLLAGVDHFYLYDNESPDNQREVAAPYVKAGLVDYINAPGKVMQCAAYNDAIKRFKFHCRYMAFIDGDEFIFPRTGGGIVKTVDEIFSHDKHAAGLAINWQCFGSNGHENADYSKGVLERFTRRAPSDWKINEQGGNALVKSISNPRKINFMGSPHVSFYFMDAHLLNETSSVIGQTGYNFNGSVDKIAVNHYHTKSREEHKAKTNRGRADVLTKKSLTEFEVYDRNEVFDDGILRYRDERAKTFTPPDKARVAERLLNALIKNLSPTLLPTTPPNFYAGKMETFLTCREVAALLKTKLVEDTVAKFFEEAALRAILYSINGMSFADARLFLRELPKLLALPYPAAKEIRAAALQIIPQLMSTLRLNIMWYDYVEMDYLNDILKLGG